MTGPRRALKIFVGLLMIFCAVIMLRNPEDGHYLVMLILFVSLAADGIRNIIYYFSLARYMVGGMVVLFKGLIMLDSGLFALNLNNAPERYVMLYLIAYLIFSGAIDILHSLDAKRIGASWRYELFYGLGEVGIAAACLFFLDSSTLLTYLYSLGLIHAGVSRIVTACRKTAIVYIEG